MCCRQSHLKLGVSQAGSLPAELHLSPETGVSYGIRSVFLMVQLTLSTVNCSFVRFWGKFPLVSSLAPGTQNALAVIALIDTSWKHWRI